ncbi:EamA family transporter [Bradyrhizobium xenonodulans]|uniref:EamA family transporter n=1 Tax=Bradyrhizobium xenonodulans TaxID=2736875 RepID=A0ABY7MWF2_9BRAD|nr:EamA family transporter [Bradyrhizobium xenonodulans]WBL81879.1 EamA family transporter [Bradyrhizobium xenonodulans]
MTKRIASSSPPSFSRDLSVCWERKRHLQGLSNHITGYELIMPPSSVHLAIVSAFAAIYLVWGSTYLALALALQSLPPFTLMAARCLMGGAILFGAARAAGASSPPRKTCLVAMICGVLFFVGCHGVLAYAQQRVHSGLAAVLLATIPLWIVLLQVIFPGSERPNWKTVAFLIPGVAGVALIASHEASAGRDGLRASDVLLLLGAALSWAAGTFVSERHSGTSSPVALSGLELLAGGVVLLAIGAARGELGGLHLSSISAASIAGWTYLTLMGTVVAFAAYIWLLKQVPSTLVSTYTFVNPIIAVLLGWAFLGETPSLWMLAGAALVIASVAGLLLARSKSQGRANRSWSVQLSEG